MKPGGDHAGSTSAPYGTGFRYGSNSTTAPPPRLPPVEQMTREQKEAVLLAAGRLAAEYLVSIGKLPPHVLQNRPPPPPRWFHERPHAPQHQTFQERQHAPQHGQPQPGTFQAPQPRLFQQGGRSFGNAQFQSQQQGPPRRFAPHAFQDRPIAKRPRPQPPRPFRCGGRGGAAPPKTERGIGQGAAQMQGAVPVLDEPAASGDGSNRQQPVPKSGGAGAVESPETTDQLD